jgi:hypothetical protein
VSYSQRSTDQLPRSYGPGATRARAFPRERQSRARYVSVLICVPAKAAASFPTGDARQQALDRAA